MRINRSLAGLAALTAVTLSTAACGNADTEPSTAPASAGTSAQSTSSQSTSGQSTSGRTTPDETLLAAVPDEADPAFAFSTQGGCIVSFTGIFDAPGEAIQTSITQQVPDAGKLSMTFLAIGKDKPFARIATEPASLATRMGVPKSWMSLDPAKIDGFEDSPLHYDGRMDPLGMGTLIRNASDIVQEGAGYTGSIDLTAIAKDEAVIAPATLKKLGDDAKAVPFEAAVDATSGNLTTLKIRIPARKACTLTYDQYGEVKSLTPPKATKATAGVYAMLNS